MSDDPKPASIKKITSTTVSPIPKPVTQNLKPPSHGSATKPLIIQPQFSSSPHAIPIASLGRDVKTTKFITTNISPELLRRKIRGKITLNNVRIGLMGGGKITEALVKGFIDVAKVSCERIYVTSPRERTLIKFRDQGIKTSRRNMKLFYRCDVIFLCVNGSVIKACESQDGEFFPLCPNYIKTNRKLYIISLISGIRLKDIKKCLFDPTGERQHVEMYRIMINAACAYGMGVCAISRDPQSSLVSPLVRNILKSISKLVYIPEDFMDSACAAAGHGLAFAFQFIDALANGANKIGLSKDQAFRFTAKVAQCGAQTVIRTKKHPVELEEDVCTPLSAAVYGLNVLIKNDVASSVVAAVEAAYKRAMQLQKVRKQTI